MTTPTQKQNRSKKSTIAMDSTLEKASGGPERAVEAFAAASKPARSYARFETLEPRVLLSADINPAQPISGAIDAPGETDTYAFTLTNDTKIVFDSLTNNSNITWTLTGPKGVEVASRALTGSDSVSLSGSPLLDLVAGEYSLTVDANNDVTGNYSFRLIDLERTQQVTPGTPVTGELGPANETDVYRFNAVAGDSVYFDRQSLVGSTVYWRLLDPYGRSVFGPTSMSNDVGPVALTVGGMYTLLVEGYVSSIGTTSYGFTIDPRGNTPVAPLPVGVPLVLGATTAGNITSTTQKDDYNFTLAGDAKIYFDSLTNNGNLRWSLVGPLGTVVSARSLTTSDSGSLAGSAIYALTAGEYVLTAC